MILLDFVIFHSRSSEDPFLNEMFAQFLLENPYYLIGPASPSPYEQELN